MRKLTRGQNAPACLAQYHYAHHPWNPGNAEKDEIWRELNAMQNQRCAYCEADISTFNSRHIDHSPPEPCTESALTCGKICSVVACVGG